MKKFLIFASSYDEVSGGAIVLHKLCHLLNTLGHESYLYPKYEDYQASRSNLPRHFVRMLNHERGIRRKHKKFKVNPVFNTPVYKKTNDNFGDDWVVVYPEVTAGNPLRAKNIVRWLLHQPGFHNGKVNYYTNELYFKFNSAIRDFHIYGSVTSENELKICQYPLEHYNTLDLPLDRSGTAHCIRKAVDKDIVHDLNSSISIDGLPHNEAAKILKSVKTFISYDSLTAYSIFASLCGATSIVVPDSGVDIDEWYPDPEDRNGIAYGFSDSESERAHKTAPLLLDRVLREEAAALQRAKSFVTEVNDFFNDDEKQE